ncbi:MAG TPA: hypothetical protein VG936_03575 [Lacunisphaera sp.]|nr:hypothetical protein [Lacunisphaera sp.]
MSPKKESSDSILMKEAVGFSSIILLAWAAEIAEVPHFFFGELAHFNWSRVLFRTGVVLVIWLWVHVSTRKLLARLHYLEEFLLVCSWCRRVGHEGKWLTTEEYFGSKFATETSHGICPECAQRQFGAGRTVQRVDHPD